MSIAEQIELFLIYASSTSVYTQAIRAGFGLTSSIAKPAAPGFANPKFTKYPGMAMGMAVVALS